MTRSIPIASVAVTLSSMASIETLRAAKNEGVRIAKTPAMTSQTPAMAACRKSRLGIRRSQRRGEKGCPRRGVAVERAHRAPLPKDEDAARDEQELFEIARDEQNGDTGVE